MLLPGTLDGSDWPLWTGQILQNWKYLGQICRDVSHLSQASSFSSKSLDDLCVVNLASSLDRYIIHDVK